MQVYHRPALVSLPLQISLYYNIPVSVIFATVVGSCSVQKMMFYDRLVSLSVLIIWTVIEPLRIYVGMRGNMQEKVPDTATYLLMTAFPQFPIVLYLAYLQPTMFPVDPVLGSLMIVFLLAEFFFGVVLVRRQIKLQTASFMSSIESID
jgi:transmembrane protein 17